MTTQIKVALAEKIHKNIDKFEEWLNKKSASAPPPFYSSIDLRDAGFKIAPVDCNLFPAGFNNICDKDLSAAAAVFKNELKSAKKVLILPESHTSNKFYIENLYYLSKILSDAGIETKLGWYDSEADAPIHLTSATGKELVAYPIKINGGVASAGDFVPDAILLNNDFSSGYPEALDRLTQPVLPSHILGWHSRTKIEHFNHYNFLAREFAELMDIDPWLIQIDTRAVENINFSDGSGIENVAATVDEMLKSIGKSYSEKKVEGDPFVFIKSNKGTYGMGVMVARSAKEVLTMNRKSKNKMSTGKGRTAIESVVVQEGVPTATVVNRLPAEPVIYLVRSILIGGFLRANTKKSSEENLNSPGMVFKKLCMSDLQELISSSVENKNTSYHDRLLELVYGSIAQLSTLAAGIEIKDSTPTK